MPNNRLESKSIPTNPLIRAKVRDKTGKMQMSRRQTIHMRFFWLISINLHQSKNLVTHTWFLFSIPFVLQVEIVNHEKKASMVCFSPTFSCNIRWSLKLPAGQTNIFNLLKIVWWDCWTPWFHEQYRIAEFFNLTRLNENARQHFHCLAQFLQPYKEPSESCNEHKTMQYSKQI